MWVCATTDKVKEKMKSHSWVHFACHGIQDRKNPLQSGVHLHNGCLELLEIMQQKIPNSELAFLSACQTSKGDTELSEEAVHLAAGMLLAGYRGVVATLWTIMDNDAPQVVNDVYKHLFKTSPADPTQAAEALHLAIRALGKDSAEKKSLFHWVPFIHVRV